jgi:UDP-N-acetylmuramate--alanine ligase
MDRIHFIGIGGVGMNGLAQLAALSDCSVSGSDRSCNPDIEPFRSLEDLGIHMAPQDGSGIRADTDQVVFSTAIESDNPELVRAQELGIPLLHRAEFLKELVRDRTLIAVAGTAGKTTTTGLLGWIFECLGKDPTVYNGAAVLNWKNDGSLGNVRKGSSDLWIIEADESDKSFLNFHPSHSIITNISKDHYELDELHRMFDRFESQTTGVTIRGQSLKPGICFNPGTGPYGTPLLGQHNLENANCAAQLCKELGMDMNRVGDAVSRFKGIERRLEIVGETHGLAIIDDYAHNPAKIAAALSAVTEAYGKTHAYWRPHGFTPLFQCEEDLIRIFKQAQPASLFILPVFYAGGTVERKTSSREFVGKLNSAGIPAKLVPDYVALKHELEHSAKAGDAILGMGARDPELPQFAKKLVAEWKTP